MWRSFFIAIGAMMMIVGVEAMLIDSATVYAAAESSAAQFINPNAPPAIITREIRPGEWTPWVIFSLGAVTVLYALTLPQRWGKAGHAG